MAGCLGWQMIGFMPAVGELSPMADQWPGRRSAARAVTGSGGNRVLVGHQPCSCRGGHTSWTCLECGATVYGPPLHVDCRVLAGPAAVR
jgi:hypothetical protein